MMGATREEEYFRRQQKDQLDNLKKKLEADMTQSQQEIRDHEKVRDTPFKENTQENIVVD